MLVRCSFTAALALLFGQAAVASDASNILQVTAWDVDASTPHEILILPNRERPKGGISKFLDGDVQATSERLIEVQQLFILTERERPKGGISKFLDGDILQIGG